MNTTIFLILNLALAFYNCGTIWAVEVDIFRSWKYLPPEIFHQVQHQHWKKIPYWIFIPVGLSFLGSIVLFWYHPGNIPPSEIWAAFLAQLISHSLSAVFWGRWQSKLARDSQGGASPWLKKILTTHWIRTSLINLYGFILLLMTLQTLS